VSAGDTGPAEARLHRAEKERAIRLTPALHATVILWRVDTHFKTRRIPVLNQNCFHRCVHGFVMYASCVAGPHETGNSTRALRVIVIPCPAPSAGAPVSRPSESDLLPITPFHTSIKNYLH